MGLGGLFVPGIIDIRLQVFLNVTNDGLMCHSSTKRIMYVCIVSLCTDLSFLLLLNWIVLIQNSQHLRLLIFFSDKEVSKIIAFYLCISCSQLVKRPLARNQYSFEEHAWFHGFCYSKLTFKVTSKNSVWRAQSADWCNQLYWILETWL